MFLASMMIRDGNDFKRRERTTSKTTNEDKEDKEGEDNVDDVHKHQVLREILRRVENALADGWIRETSDCATAKRRRRRQRRGGRNEYDDDDDDDDDRPPRTVLFSVAQGRVTKHEEDLAVFARKRRQRRR